MGAPGEPTIRGFQSLVGSLLWIARCTRSDISFTVHKATRRTHQPTMSDWKLAKKIARYLKDTKGLKLTMQAVSKSVDLQEALGVALSTMEAEFTSASHVGRELPGMRQLVRELGFRVVEPLPMKMDNQAVIKQLD
ncbi:hypothetical protein PC110_g21693 [Phytophthora cactorum]|uniref:Uncharacterized protein n=2 Tax=Phytophthora cactorum TaxID=29920 RepID=A0A329REJ5_9STRA|nr:hypothetical protein PC110_g21693 [Phytophthora cactorum]